MLLELGDILCLYVLLRPEERLLMVTANLDAKNDSRPVGEESEECRFIWNLLTRFSGYRWPLVKLHLYSKCSPLNLQIRRLTCDPV